MEYSIEDTFGNAFYKSHSWADEERIIKGFDKVLDQMFSFPPKGHIVSSA